MCNVHSHPFPAVNDACNRTEQFRSETETEAVSSVENPGFRVVELLEFKRRLAHQRALIAEQTSRDLGSNPG